VIIDAEDFLLVLCQLGRGSAMKQTLWFGMFGGVASTSEEGVLKGLEFTHKNPVNGAVSTHLNENAYSAFVLAKARVPLESH
jgi:hypothetical protein